MKFILASKLQKNIMMEVFQSPPTLQDMYDYGGCSHDVFTGFR